MIIKRSSLTSRAAAMAPTTTSRGSSSRDILAAGESRLRAKLIADSLDMDRQVAALRAGTLRAEDIQRPETLTAADMLTTNELLELDRADRSERHIADQTKKTLGAMAQWLLSNPDCPATQEAGEKLAAYCQQREWNVTWNHLDTAYAALLASGEIVQDFRKSNADAHNAHADTLRANGIKVEPFNPGAVSADEMEIWHATTQPLPSREHAFLDYAPETTYEPPHVPTLDDFDNN